ncbi:D-alanine--poly(phosphoribitol) ligase subunit 2 [Methylomarinovum caldicuralii]|uniref:D-alanine--poly(Phosphoribitol) ligase subunit 2 n=1 Tax=Methylomarinovum caldicuralii TaxID=438856 RepID=A0AAU9BZY2_9GAMM|nr:acyl carrier protein [Methylomarinovum caldicuralii]BCX80833.1 D-alanine--poly(phosphoribitol) ligase subunit 2 [Methylomarinovum caldicuralii]
MNDIKSRLRDFVLGELVYCEDPDAFGDDDDLLEAGLDSLGIMRLIMFAEREFDVTLPDTDIEPDTVRTLERLSRWIEAHRR